MEFKISDKPVQNLRMIEKHFFKDTLLKSFDFEFGFVIPNSKNTMEHIYNFPEISSEMSESFFTHTSQPTQLPTSLSK